MKSPSPRLLVTSSSPRMTLAEAADAAEVRALFTMSAAERARDARRLRHDTEDIVHFRTHPARYLDGGAT